MIEILLLVITINTTIIALISLDAKLSERQRWEKHLQHDADHSKAQRVFLNETLEKTEAMQRELNQENLKMWQNAEKQDE